MLTEGLVARGVDVTLFATGDSITRARLAAAVPTGYSEDLGSDAKVSECLHISAVFERADEFDLIHNSYDFLPLTYSGLVATPVVTTIHGFSSELIVPVFRKYNSRGHYVAISEADRHPELDYAATIHHGIDMDAFDVGTRRGDYLLFLGRIHPDKGTAEAVEVAVRSGVPLVIAGIIQDRDYFDSVIAPRIDGELISYLGPVERSRLNELLGDTRALLHLINFEEPLGSASGGNANPSLFAEYGEALQKKVDPYAGSCVSGSIFGERPARFENHVRINKNVSDAWGIPALHIEVKDGENEHNMAKDASNTIEELFHAAGWDIISKTPNFYPPGYSIHEVGTARMGEIRRPAC